MPGLSWQTSLRGATCTHVSLQVNILISLESNLVQVAFWDGFDNGNYITCELWLGGVSKSIKILYYAKGNSGGSVLVKLGGADNTQVGEFLPQNTGGLGKYVGGNTVLDVDVFGSNELTFVAK